MLKLKIAKAIQFVELGSIFRWTEPKLDGANVVVKSGKADFGSAEVDINADNPLKIVAQKATWDDDAFKVTEETTVDATTVNASGGGNGHSVGTEDYTFG